MENRLKNALRFYLLATQLQDKIRTGWDKNHWDIQKERIESVSEHVYDTCILALAIDSEFETHLDMGKVMKMLVLHEIGEVLIGDITPFDHISPEEKKKREHEAILEVLGDLIKKDEYDSLLLEFDEHKTKESIFAYHCDKFDADLRAKIYQDRGYQKPLDRQENNVVFQSKKIRQMVSVGAQTAFDIWYEWDKVIYAEDETFSALLEFLKTVNTKEDFF